MDISELLIESCMVAGEWIAPNRLLDVTNPADGTLVGRVPDLPPEDVDRAIMAAHRARTGWAATSAKERADLLKRLHALVMEHQEPLARILTSEQGKPLDEARNEIAYAASFLEWFAEEGRRADGQVVPSNSRSGRIVVLRQPVGVVAAITPWNFPAAMVTRKIGPALAAGCTVILKPSELTPFTALAIAKLAERAGIPPGVLNVVTGDAVRIGAALTVHPLVRKLTFTGSTRVGAILYAQSAPSIKKVSLELGGNAPFVVFDDADLDAAVHGAMASKFRNAGQTCVCTNRFIVQDGIHDAFVAKLSAAMAELQVGPGCDEGSTVGPLISSTAIGRVDVMIDDAVAKGARLLRGGRRHPIGDLFYEPTLLAGATPSMSVWQDEIFGPVATVTRFADEDEAIALANAGQHGLAAYLFTRDLARGWRVMERLECGMVGVNTGMISTEVAPFGGTRFSGLGREGGHEGLADYMESKYCAVELAPA